MKYISNVVVALSCLAIGAFASPMLFSLSGRVEERDQLGVIHEQAVVPPNQEKPLVSTSNHDHSSDRLEMQYVKKVANPSQIALELRIRKLISKLEGNLKDTTPEESLGRPIAELKSIAEQLTRGVLQAEKAEKRAVGIVTELRNTREKSQAPRHKASNVRRASHPKQNTVSMQASSTVAASKARIRRELQAKYDKLKLDAQVLSYNMKQDENRYEKKLHLYFKQEKKINRDFTDGRIKKKSWRSRLDRLDDEVFRYKQSESNKRDKAKSYLRSFQQKMAELKSKALSLGVRLEPE